MRHFVLSLLLLVSFVRTQAQTLLVSDIDDTIKLADVRNLISAAGYAFDDKSQFTGMSQLYNIIVRDLPETQVVYLSKAPKFLMAKTHREFLRKGQFPAGRYFPRDDYGADEHKLKVLRSLIQNESPRTIILIGDNGEKDAQVYAQIAKEFSSQGIRFLQFIHIVYKNEKYKGHVTFLNKDQVGFVTPIEVALELQKNRIIHSRSTEWLIENVGSHIVEQSLFSKEGNVAFPYFMNCSDFIWKWDDQISDYPNLSNLKAKLDQRCGFSFVN